MKKKGTQKQCRSQNGTQQHKELSPDHENDLFEQMEKMKRRSNNFYIMNYNDRPPEEIEVLPGEDPTFLHFHACVKILVIHLIKRSKVLFVTQFEIFIGDRASMDIKVSCFPQMNILIICVANVIETDVTKNFYNDLMSANRKEVLEHKSYLLMLVYGPPEVIEIFLYQSLTEGYSVFARHYNTIHVKTSKEDETTDFKMK